jgi:hypothetical protein
VNFYQKNKATRNAQRKGIFMLKAILLAMMMATVLSIGSSRNAVAMSLDLSQFRWKNRLLLLFAPNRNHPFFDTLHKALEVHKAEAKDRDLVIFEILESGRSSRNTNNLDYHTAQSLREKFNITRGEFAVILIGKDGGMKLNRRDQTQLMDIFALIDAMPMRQEEMRQRTQ